MLHRFKHTTSRFVHFRVEVLRYLFLAITAVLISILFFTAHSYSREVFDEKTPVLITDDFTVTTADFQNTQAKLVVGFLPSWSIAQNAQVHPEYLDQIIYFGLGINDNGELMKFNDDGDALVEWTYFLSDTFENIRIRTKDTNTKILIAIKNFDNTSIDTLISSNTHRKRAIKAITTLVNDYQLDGVNIDFEYFTKTDFPTMRFYNQFLTELSQELKKQNPDAVLSVDINATAVYRDNAYDIVKIGDVVDHVIVMGYDYHIQTSSFVGPVAPIAADEDEPSLTKTIESMKGRIEPHKVILAVPLYGYEWQTYTKAADSRTIPQTGALATYKRVRELISVRDDLSISYDDLSQSPRIVYVQNGLIKQIYYDDEKSLMKKYELIAKHNLGGMGLWALGYEGDFIEPWNLIKEIRTSR
ncbi:MAG: Glycosyl hydrolase, family 18 [Candidatus Roizmanbacteria bacterium GW2011_GWA2_37_7]|uniref:Glycosyl hydrolase, family 18 n=1 Tax=Candidatus Roizmanbacteria bacterium GW2011_GWA2_37_7 TaxID=1618481 RepID=A0A0G0H2D8_9BACT|nr:MAG: Glycosyl hydrolase, family 18 [Candidatus Roizmanbacteria bacterium GW2011_GWA2_37_7]